MDENLRKVILKDDYDVDNWKYGKIISYDTTKTDIIDIENIIQLVKEKEDYTLDDVVENLYKLEGIIDIEDLDFYEVYY